MKKKLRIAVRSFADFQAALAAQLAAYREQQSPLHINVEIITYELRDLEHVVLSGDGQQQDGWDLAIFPTDWVGAAVESGSLESLTPWMRTNPLPDWPEGWPASLREPLRIDNDFYCIPWHDGPECLIYRKDLFESDEEQHSFMRQHGGKLVPPATWTAFRQTARVFTRPMHGLYGTLFAAYPDGHNTLYDLVLQVWSRGGELYSTDGQPMLDHPVVVDALDYYRGIILDPTACYPGAAEIDSIRSGDIFLSGQIAMMVNWFGFAARCNRPGSPLQGKIGLAPVPGGGPGQTASLSNYWVIGIAAASQQKEASYDLLRHISSPAMDKLTALNGAVGVRFSTWSDPEVVERIPLYSQLERLSANARTLPFCEDLPRLAEILDQVTIEALSTDEPSEAILNRAQARALGQQLHLAREPLHATNLNRK